MQKKDEAVIQSWHLTMQVHSTRRRLWPYLRVGEPYLELTVDQVVGMTESSVSMSDRIPLINPPPRLGSAVQKVLHKVKRVYASNITAGILLSLGLMMILGYTSKLDPILSRQIQLLLAPRKPAGPIIAQLCQADPRLGSTPVTGRRLLLQGGVARSGMLLWLGDCQSCLNTDVTPWIKSSLERKIPLVVASSAPTKKTAQFLERIGFPNYQRIVQVQLVEATDLNLVFSPRLYYFTTNLQLSLIQRNVAYPGYNPLLDLLSRKGLK